MNRNHADLYRRCVARDAGLDGRAYMGVHTTGIVCLPSCAARKPKPEHVTFFRTLQAALKEGFRPCKRCRPEDFHPERLPDAGFLEGLQAWLAAPESMNRSVPDLASSLGLSSDALEARFRRHFQRSPAQWLRRRRMLHAEWLLAHTDQSLLDVALACGFESHAAFHAQCLQILAMTPAARREAGPSFAFRVPQGFPWEAVLDYHGRDPESPSERREGRVLFKALWLGADPVTVAIQPAGPVDLKVTVHGACDPNYLKALPTRLRRMVGLGEAPSGFERRARTLPPFAPLVAARPGLRVPLTESPWEALVWAVLGQQVNLAFAMTLRRRLIQRAVAQEAPLGLRPHPQPGHLVTLTEADLQEAQCSRAKARTLLEAARLCFEGALDLEALACGSAQEADRQLQAIPGIGPWTAQYVLMRGMGFQDCVPVGDAGLTLALQRTFGLATRPDRAATQALLEPLAPYRSLAVFHLWASLKGRPE